MPDTIPTEEQKQHLSTILKRWNDTDKTHSEYFGACNLIILSPFVIWWLTSDFSNAMRSLTVILFYGGVTAFLFLRLWYFNHIRASIPRKLTHEDSELLKWASETYNSWDATYILNQYNNLQLLRASTEPQDDTLLRAAAHTDNTPQEQLLRPVSDNEPSP